MKTENIATGRAPPTASTVGRSLESPVSYRGYRPTYHRRRPDVRSLRRNEKRSPAPGLQSRRDETCTASKLIELRGIPSRLDTVSLVARPISLRARRRHHRSDPLDPLYNFRRRLTPPFGPPRASKRRPEPLRVDGTGRTAAEKAQVHFERFKAGPFDGLVPLFSKNASQNVKLWQNSYFAQPKFGNTFYFHPPALPRYCMGGENRRESVRIDLAAAAR